MATFVLIHGAWHGGWCFDDVRLLLEAQGHKVITPDLPGMGGTDAELAAVTLSGWADFVSDICNAQGEPVILAGHSRGGIVISETAERVPDRLAALVYICAMMLPDGMSRAQWREKHGQPNPEFAAIQRDHPGGHAKIIDTTHAIPVFAQLSPPEKAEAAMARLVAEPDGPRTEPLHLTADRYGSVPRHYIECLHDRTIPIADQRTMQALQPCASVTALDADHSPFLSAPQALADALIVIARGVTS
jgi:pimeloyl-ACP methyl ester carboxylesterase